MRVDIAPHFPLPGFWSDRACAEVVYEFDGQRYYLRQMDKHILYRVADRDSLEHTLYVPCRAIPGTPGRPLHKNEKTWTPAVYPEDVFREQVRAGENGRLALYACPQARDCVAALFFSPDGMGKFLDYYTSNKYSAHLAEETLDFLWDGRKYGMVNFADILTCEWETLLPLCEDVFTQQVWPRMRDPYVTYEEFSDEALGFVSGSFNELELITRCICHADDTLFRDAKDTRSVMVTYHAKTTRCEGGPQNKTGFSFRSPTSVFAHEMCGRVFAHNPFEGGEWKYKRYGGDTRRESYHLEPAAFMIEAAPPSAHERAEALLTLYDWLEGKVSEGERAKLLGLEGSGI